MVHRRIFNLWEITNINQFLPQNHSPRGIGKSQNNTTYSNTINIMCNTFLVSFEFVTI